MKCNAQTVHITLSKGDRSVNAKGIFALMGPGVKQGDVVTVTIEGEDENIAAVALKNYKWSIFENITWTLYQLTSPFLRLKVYDTGKIIR